MTAKKTFKQLKQDLGIDKHVQVAYASIGNREDSHTPKTEPYKKDDTPSAYGSIGNREDVHTPKDKADYHKADHVFLTIHDRGNVNESSDQTDYGWNSQNEHLQGLHNELRELHHDHVFNNDPFKHVPAYSGGSGELNDTLIKMYQYGAHPDVPHQVKDFFQRKEYHPMDSRRLQDFDHGISMAIGDAPKLHKGIDLYTGVGWQFDVSKQRAANGDRLHLPAYTSTSIDPGVARQFAFRGDKENREIVKIHLPEGSQHGAYIASRSAHPYELEFLLHRNKNLKFIGEPERKDGYLFHHATLED